MMRDTYVFHRVPDFTSTFYLKFLARMFLKYSHVPQNIHQITFREHFNYVPVLKTFLGNTSPMFLFPKYFWGTWGTLRVPQMFIFFSLFMN